MKVQTGAQVSAESIQLVLPDFPHLDLVVMVLNILNIPAIVSRSFYQRDQRQQSQFLPANIRLLDGLIGDPNPSVLPPKQTREGGAGRGGGHT